MNKLLVFICFLSGFVPLKGEEDLNKTELRGAAFIPSGHTFRDVYGNVLPSIQIEQARTFHNLTNLEVWGNLEWIFSNVKSSFSCGKSTINMLNISTGLKGIGPVYQDIIYLYAGIGPDLGITWIQNWMECCADCYDHQTSHSCNVGVGGIAKSGCQIFCTPSFYLDFFADYLYLPMHFHDTKNIGGLKVGLGLSARY
jgi:hypothetical protein